MPSREFHNKLNKKILGKEYDRINELIDVAWHINPKKHREIFGHDMDMPILVLLATGNRKKALAAYLHIFADKNIET